jgi:hypothetical protein
MSKNLPSREASATNLIPHYERHRSEQTLLYQLVERYYPQFVDLRESQGRALPSYVQRTFEEYLKCGRLEHG